MTPQRIKQIRKMSAQQAIDALGMLRAKIGPLVLEDELLRRRILSLARHKNKAWDAVLFRATVSIKVQRMYDTKKLDRYLSEDVQKKMKKRITQEVVNVRALKKARHKKPR